MKKLSSEELRIEIKALTEKGSPRFVLTQRELSDAIQVSATYLNKWINRAYPHDPTHIEALLASWLKSRSLSARDERKLLYIQSLIDHADDCESVLAAIARRYTKTEEGS